VYVAAWLLVEGGLLGLYGQWVQSHPGRLDGFKRVSIVAGIRSLTSSVTVNISIFDRFIKGDKGRILTSYCGLGLSNFGANVLFWPTLDWPCLRTSLADHSTLACTSPGYGDISPRGGEGVGSRTGITGTVFVLLVLTRFIAALPGVEAVFSQPKQAIGRAVGHSASVS
jgi:hypothetical protein